MNDLEAATLRLVCTVSEVVRHWHKPQKSVMMYIYKGKLEARHTHYRGVWLVSVTSVKRLWGESPSFDMEDDCG